jgi:hypothetical protein
LETIRDQSVCFGPVIAETGMTQRPTPVTAELEKNQCPHCGTELDIGFGLAGGGYGAYTYCPSETCGKYFDKTQEQDDRT